MKNWSFLLVMAIAILLMPVFSAQVSAQEEAGLSISKSADLTSAYIGDNISYTYTIANTSNVTINNITLEDDRLGRILLDTSSLAPGDNVTATAIYTVVGDDFPDPLANTAVVNGTGPSGNITARSALVSVALNTLSIKVTKAADKVSASPSENITYNYTITNTGTVVVDNVTLEDDRLGRILLDTSSLAPGDSVNATATYTVAISDLPGPIVNTASVTGVDPTGKSISATSNSVSVSLKKSSMTKAEILKQSGVPGKGINTAPGLQKLFNPKSKAAEHAGKKDKPVKNELKTKSRVENQSVLQQLRIRSEVENHP